MIYDYQNGQNYILPNIGHIAGKAILELQPCFPFDALFALCIVVRLRVRSLD